MQEANNNNNNKFNKFLHHPVLEEGQGVVLVWQRAAIDDPSRVNGQSLMNRSMRQKNQAMLLGTPVKKKKCGKSSLKIFLKTSLTRLITP